MILPPHASSANCALVLLGPESQTRNGKVRVKVGTLGKHANKLVRFAYNTLAW